MILVGTTVVASDNSGALTCKCIRVYNRKSVAKIGDVILVSIKSYKPKRKLRSGELFKAFVVRIKYTTRTYNNYIKFNDNAVVLLNKKNLPIGTKLFGVSIKYIRFLNRKIYLLLQNII